MASLRAQLNVVLHQVRSPQNLGGVARAMANFGVRRLWLSEPLTWALQDAERTAVKGTGILEGLKMALSLEEALGEAVYAVGTTSRTAIKGRRTLSPEEAVRSLAAQAERGRVALVFGGEQRGLSDEDLERCHDVLVIPTEAEQPSMNLAQCAALLLYLCAREERPLGEAPPEEGARLQTVHALEARQRKVWLASGFLNPQAPDHILHELSRALVKANLTQREAELWLAAFAQLERLVTTKDGGLGAPKPE